MEGSEKHQIQNGSNLQGGREENQIRERHTGNFNDIYSLKRYYSNFKHTQKQKKIVKPCT